MNKGVYYNEIDTFAAAWLRELIKAGQIAPGVVDERSIEDVVPEELAGFSQCHFFAGIGTWSYALRRAGWADDRPVWTGSCPCQPFSAAGKGKGFADERHLWPAFFHLISQCKPVIIFGEQVASKDGLVWLDLVSADLENEGYTCGAVDSCAAGYGAPHIRQRLYWVAHAGHSRENADVGLDNSFRKGLERYIGNGQGEKRRQEPTGSASKAGRAGRMENTESFGLRRGNNGDTAWMRGKVQVAGRAASCGAMPTNSFWSNPDWLFCRDGKWRPVESGSCPLAHGAAARVGRLRGTAMPLSHHRRKHS